MGSHDDYGKKVLLEAAGKDYEQYGPSVEVDYGAGMAARIDGAIGSTIAVEVEVESRTSKQVRGAVLDLICHPYTKKLLLLLPVHMPNPAVSATQCSNILGRFCKPQDFRVLVLKGSGNNPQQQADVLMVSQAIRDLS